MLDTITMQGGLIKTLQDRMYRAILDSAGL